MAVVIEGSSKCPLCGKVIEKSTPYRLIPPLISNKNDKLFQVSDYGVHIDCLEKFILKEKLMFHVSKYQERLPPSKLKCIVDNQPVSDPQDFIYIGLLTSDENEAMHKFNYITLNKKNLSKWVNRREFLNTVEDFILKGKWESLTDFNYLNYLLNKIKD